MVQRKGGVRRKSRSKLRKNYKTAGKVSLTKFMQKFEVGDKVYLGAESAYQKGMYDLKFHGRTGVVTGKKGRCYTVNINYLGAKKTTIVHPIHLRKVSAHVKPKDN